MRQVTHSTSVAEDGLQVNLGPFRRWLRERNRTDRTIHVYAEAVDRLDAYLASKGMPRQVENITREHVGEFIRDVLDHWKPATAANRYRSLKQFFRYLVLDGEIKESPMARMELPKVPEQPVPVLKEDDLRALVRACEGTAFEDRRDLAIIRLMIDTGARIGEVLALRWCPDDAENHDVDLDAGVARVLGKGRRWRMVPINAKASRAMDRYLRLRRQHVNASSTALWLGRRGALTDQGLRLVIRRRGELAGLGRIWPHMIRHSLAHAWQADGRNPVDLQRIMGWSDLSMLARYAASSGQERALAAAKRDPLGDRL